MGKYKWTLLVDEKWYREHQNDHTQEEIDNLTIEIITDKSKKTLKAGMKNKDIRNTINNEQE